MSSDHTDTTGSPDSSETNETGSKLIDHLRLQAWLAGAEIRNPSVHKEVTALAQWRDDLRVQAWLGRAEVRQEWERLEAHWVALKPRLEQKLEAAVDVGSDEAKRLLKEIREGYHRLTG